MLVLKAYAHVGTNDITTNALTFSNVEPLSEDDVWGIKLSSSNASCLLDPIPTSLLRGCLDAYYMHVLNAYYLYYKLHTYI